MTGDLSQTEIVTARSGYDLLTFVTVDNGSTWRGTLAAKDVK